MVKSRLERAGRTADILFNVGPILHAHHEYKNADEEHEQEKFDDLMRAVGNAVLPFEGRLFMLMMEQGDKIIDPAITAVRSLCKVIRRES